MQNKTRITFPRFNLSVKPERLVCFLGKVFERGDKRQVPATGDQMNKILGMDANLDEKLEALQKLNREKRGKTKGTEKAWERLAEEINRTEISAEEIAVMSHELVEAHDKEVGTAIKIRKDQYILAHASKGATELILKHHKVEIKTLSAEKLKEIFKKAGFNCEEIVYGKDEIPKAKPFSKVIEEWKMDDSKKEKVVEQPTVQSVGKFRVDKLMKNGAQEYQESLNKLYNGVITINKTENLRDPTTHKKAGTAQAGDRFKIIEDVGKRGKYEYKIVQKIGENGQPEGKEYKLCINDGNRVSVGIPEDVKRLFGLDGKINIKDQEAMRKFRRGSTRQFEEWVDQSDLDNIQKAELIAAFKVLDVSYGRIANGSSLERIYALDRSTKRNGGEKTKELFAGKLGFGMDWNVLYANFGEKKLGETPEKYKSKVESILRGGEVFMLRVDQKTHGGKLEARIDRSSGDAWADNIGASKQLRGDSSYIYKYLEIRDSQQKEAILKKYLDGKFNKNEIVNYQIAQIEIPNCENPAIVVKALEKVVVTIEQPPKQKVSLTMARYFHNVPGDWTLALRPLDWFTAKAQRNYLADPAILSLEGKTLRRSEYLSARKRLDPKPKKYLEKRIDKVLGWRFDEVQERGVEKLLDNYLSKKIIVKEGGKDFQRTNEKLIQTALGWLKREMLAAGNGKDLKSFERRAKAKEAWKKEWKKRGCDEKMLEMAEILSDWEVRDFDGLKREMKREAQAYKLAGYLKSRQNYKEFTAKRASEISDPKIKKILHELEINMDKGAIIAIESALYNEDKLNIARSSEFVGDVVIIPSTTDKKGKYKRVVWGTETSISKEIINVNSPFGLMLEVASLVNGYVIYLKTGTGKPDVLEKYLDKIKSSVNAKKKFKEIFENEKAFEGFRNFVLNGQILNESGGYGISIPLNEVRLLIPGWKLLTEYLGGKGGGGAPCETDTKITGEEGEIPPGDVVF
ncbi:hypothetical protein KAI54_01505 [Candidatus Gracilibacteria bacterium]|nr:hypothetical protein [Candidatus Gracilibacteria bacterium]